MTTTVELPVLEHRIFWNALSHITGEPSDHDDRTPQQRHADALVALCDAYGRGEVTGGRERPRILITVASTATSAKPTTTGCRRWVAGSPPLSSGTSPTAPNSNG